MDAREAYNTLGLPDGASLEQVKQTYRELAIQWHPDKLAHNPTLQHQAQERLKDINAAYDFIKAHPLVSPPEDASSQAGQSKAESSAGGNASEPDERAREHEEQGRRQAEEARAKQQQEQQESQAAEQRTRQQAQQEAEATQREEQRRQQEATRRSKANQLRVWVTSGVLALVVWHYVSSSQLTSNQQSIPPISSVASTIPKPVDSGDEAIATPVSKDQLTVQSDNTSNK